MMSAQGGSVIVNLNNFPSKNLLFKITSNGNISSQCLPNTSSSQILIINCVQFLHRKLDDSDY